MPVEATVTVRLVALKHANVLVAVAVLEDTLSVDKVMLHLARVHCAVRPAVFAVTVHFVATPVALVRRLIDPEHLSVSLFAPLSELPHEK